MFLFEHTYFSKSRVNPNVTQIPLRALYIVLWQAYFHLNLTYILHIYMYFAYAYSYVGRIIAIMLQQGVN